MSTERPSNLRPLSDFLKEKAKKELNEDPATRLQAIDDLIATYKEAYADLPLLREDDVFIIRFLRARKYNMEKSLAILYNYHKFLTDHPHFALKGTEEDGKKMAINKVAGILATKSLTGASILYLHASGLDPDNITPGDFQKGFGFFWDQLLDDEATQICGVVMLEDLEGFNFSKAKRVQKLEANMQGGEANQYHFLQNCMPLRFKGVHLVHQPWWVTFFVTVAKPFMSQKLRERFFYHGSNPESLEKFFHVKDLPKEVGGENPFDYDSTFAVCEGWRTRELVDE